MRDGGRRGLGLALAAALIGCGSEPQAIEDCLPRNGLTPICLFHGPEDLAVVDDWLIVSQMPSATGHGSLVAFHPETTTSRPLYPPATSAGDGGPGSSLDGEDASAGDCLAGEPPPISDFSPHGIDLEGTRLVVVNHGRREAIEEFELGVDAQGPTLVWRSCVALPSDASANDVVALEEGALAATKMVERPQWLGIAKLLLGLETGALLRHAPREGGGWFVVEGSEGRAPNGVEVGRDGSFFVAEWAGRRIVRISPDGIRTESAPLDFAPDNLSWASDGRLLVAGQRGSVLDVPACAAIAKGTCAMPSVVVGMDPTSLVPTPILEDDPATVLGAASIAVEQGGGLWIGAFVGDRLVRREGVR